MGCFATAKQNPVVVNAFVVGYTMHHQKHFGANDAWLWPSSSGHPGSTIRDLDLLVLEGW